MVRVMEWFEGDAEDVEFPAWLFDDDDHEHPIDTSRFPAEEDEDEVLRRARR